MNNSMRKMLSILLTICLLCSFSSSPTYADTPDLNLSDEDMVATIYNSVLEDYFTQRENLYTATNGEWDMDRFESIQEWKEILDITVQSADITSFVVDVISETDSEVKLHIYEWVWLDYVCNGYDTVDQMGFEIDHIIRLSKEDNSFSISSDSYSDFVGGYECGIEEDLAIFELEEAEFEIAMDSLPVLESSVELNSSFATLYAPNQAIAYSNQWCGSSVEGIIGTSSGTSAYNPLYAHYGGSDCCNFVSQCLAAGGISQSGTWFTTTFPNNTTPFQDVNFQYSGAAWINTQDFHDYWENADYHIITVENQSEALLLPGNPIFYLAKDGNASNHNMFIVGTNSSGQKVYNGHSPNQYRVPVALLYEHYTDGPLYSIEFVHNFVNAQSQYSSYHDLTCSACNLQVVGGHDYRLKDGVYQCIICGARVGGS